MTELKRMGIRDLRAELGRRIDAAYYLSEPTIITKSDEPRAALIPFEWLAELQALRAGRDPG